MAIVLVDEPKARPTERSADEMPSRRLGAGEFIWVDVENPNENDHDLLVIDALGIDDE